MDTPLENSHGFWNLKITWFEKETLLNHPPPFLGFNMLIFQDVSRQIMSFAQLRSAKQTCFWHTFHGRQSQSRHSELVFLSKPSSQRVCNDNQQPKNTHIGWKENKIPRRSGEFFLKQFQFYVFWMCPFIWILNLVYKPKNQEPWSQDR